MGIGTDDGTHELHLANVFLDGTSGATSRGVGANAQVAVTTDRDGRMLPGDWQWRPADDVVAYAVTCECSNPDGYGSTPTVLATWERVRRPEDEDLDLWGRLYVAPGQNAADASERPEVEAEMRRRWRKHLAPLQSTTKLETAWTRHRQALTAVDEAVKEARRAGLSWVDVGRATGMTRQAARQRWAAMPFDDPSYDPLDPGPEPDRDAHDPVDLGGYFECRRCGREWSAQESAPTRCSTRPRIAAEPYPAAKNDSRDDSGNDGWEDQMRLDEEQWREEHGG